MKNKKGKSTITIGGKEVSYTRVPATKIHAANQRISSIMRDASRSYHAKAAASKKEIATKVLNA